MATKVDEARMQTLCKRGKGSETCSFLALEGGAGFVCAKGSDIESIIRRRREEKSMRALGDNCSGPPNFTPTPA